MKVSEAFPSPWVSPKDIEKRTEVTIAAVGEVEVWDEKKHCMVNKWAIAFHRAKKRLILNKTQAFAIAAILGLEEMNDWPGGRIALEAGLARNRKPTILILAPSYQPTPPNLEAPVTPGDAPAAPGDDDETYAGDDDDDDFNHYNETFGEGTGELGDDEEWPEIPQ